MKNLIKIFRGAGPNRGEIFPGELYERFSLNYSPMRWQVVRATRPLLDVLMTQLSEEER